MTSPAGTTFKYYYDNRGRQIRSTWFNVDGSVETTIDETTYDNAGRMTSKTDANSNTTSFTYDPSGRLLTVTDALTNVTSYTYDERGHKLTQTDANTHTTTWAYDKFGRQVSRTLPMGQSETFVYNTDGTLATKTDFNGDTTTYSYEPVYKRLVNVSYADGENVTYTYDPVSGRKLTVTDSRGVTSHAYEPVTGRLSTVTNPDLSFISYTYDAVGNKRSVTTPSGTTGYTYDSLSRIFEVVDKYGHMTGYEYNIHGKPSFTTNGNGTITEYLYDDLGRLTYLENRKSDGTVISSYSYTLDNLGNRTMVVENNAKTIEYTYDELNRLTSETEIIDGYSIPVIHTYDPTGNRLTSEKITVIGNTVTTYTYDANDRVITDTAVFPGEVLWDRTYAYDNNGNTLSRTDGGIVFTYSYDSRNRLTGVVKGSDNISYDYDDNGIRVSKTLNGAVTNYIVDKNRPYAQVLEERDSVGAVTADYIYGNDLISQVKLGTQSFFHYDGHGSTRSLTNEIETVSGSYDYDAYGNLTSQSGTSTDYLYSGEQYDSDLDQYYLRARYYNQDVGRFSSMDTWGGNSDNPLSLNKYNYTESNPVMGVDPSGRFMTVRSLMASLAVTYIMSQTAVPVPNNPIESGYKIEVSISQNYLWLISNGIKVFRSPVATACPGYKARTGKFKSGKWIEKDSMDGKKIPLWREDPWNNPYGPWFLPINYLNGAYTTTGIHGVLGPEWMPVTLPKIIKPIVDPDDENFYYCSHGCIRNSNYHIQALHDLIPDANKIDILIKK